MILILPIDPLLQNEVLPTYDKDIDVLIFDFSARTIGLKDVSPESQSAFPIALPFSSGPTCPLVCCCWICMDPRKRPWPAWPLVLC